MAKPDHQDASFLVQLAQWQTTSGVSEALSWLWTDQSIEDFEAFQAANPPGSRLDLKAALICSYFDAVGALDKHRLVNEELVLDWLAVAAVWDRLRSYVMGRRRQASASDLWTNFETLATAHKRLTREYST